MNKPLVSILIPYYNDENFLEESIKSVLAQTYDNFELVLLNHACTDSSRDIAHSFDDKRIIHIDMDRNMGAGGALLIIEFLKHAKGEYIKLFAADDILKPEFLEKSVEFLQQHPETDMLFSDCEFINKKGKILKGRHSTTRKGFEFNETREFWIKDYIKGLSPLPYVSNVIRREFFEKNAYLNKTAIILQDVTLWLSMLLKGANIRFMHESYAYYRIHDNQVSSWKYFNKILRCSGYEYLTLPNLYFEIDDMKLFRELFKESEYIDLLKDDDEKIYKDFIIAQYFFNQEFLAKNAYLHMQKLLQDDDSRAKIQERFDFGVKEFRDLYSNKIKKDGDDGTVRFKILNKRAKDLSLIQLIFLTFRSVFMLVSPAYYVRKFKKIVKKHHKQYSA